VGSVVKKRFTTQATSALDTKQTPWYVPLMPELMYQPANSPVLAAKSIQRGTVRARKCMLAMQAKDPAMIALRMRTSIKRLLDNANRTTSPAIQAECIKVACQATGTFLDLISYPKRPPATSAKGLKPVMDLELPADLVQMAEESNLPDSETPEAR
jgi:hypothetical protein